MSNSFRPKPFSRRILKTDPLSTYVLEEHRPETLRANAERLRGEAGEVEARAEREKSPEKADALRAEAAGLRTEADTLDAEAERPPVTWTLQRPSVAMRFRLAEAEEHEREIGAKKGQTEKVRSTFGDFAREALFVCVKGVEGLEDEDGRPVRLMVNAPIRQDLETWWEKVPLEWGAELVNAIMETCVLSDEARGNSRRPVRP